MNFQQLHTFVHDEHQATIAKLLELWDRPLSDKLAKGDTQHFTHLERHADTDALWAYPDDNESRFREGDLICLHGGDVHELPIGRQFSLELEEEDRWLLRGKNAIDVFDAYSNECYADPDAMDLIGYYEKALNEIGSTARGAALLKLLSGELSIDFIEVEVEEGRSAALSEGFNEKQADAVGYAYGTERVACIQGPPGTGKTRVLGLIAAMSVARGERVLITSHTHMAINNALNKIYERGVPTVKVGRKTQSKGLDREIPVIDSLDDWRDLPSNSGYVVGATPFATCNRRLEKYAFDTIIFDEASQVTLPLALMAMRKGHRFIFIGDHKQLPPVLRAHSILSPKVHSAFAHLIAIDEDRTMMLDTTYRMNRWLTEWPSQTYYHGNLQSEGKNRDRLLELNKITPALVGVFEPKASAVFIPTRDPLARSRNQKDAELVVELCYAAELGGVPLSEIGIVSPYRAQGRAIRKLLTRRFGGAVARNVVADTVERMQGQERKLVILSLATGDKTYLSAIAAFFFQPERLNVSITRAKTKLIVIGPEGCDSSLIEDERVRQWIVDYNNFVAQCQLVRM